MLTSQKESTEKQQLLQLAVNLKTWDHMACCRSYRSVWVVSLWGNFHYPVFSAGSLQLVEMNVMIERLKFINRISSTLLHLVNVGKKIGVRSFYYFVQFWLQFLNISVTIAFNSQDAESYREFPFQTFVQIHYLILSVSFSLLWFRQPDCDKL